MPDLLTHVLVVYVLLQLAAWRIEWLTSGRIVVGMAGALIPDLTKIRLFVPAEDVSAVLGTPFSWEPLHALGGSLATAAILGLFVERSERRLAVSLLAFGLGVHLLLDLFLVRPGPGTYRLLYPLAWFEPPSFGLEIYHSFDYWPALASVALATIVAMRTRALDAR